MDSIDDYQSELQEIVDIERQARWLLGDKIAKGKRTFGPMAAYRAAAEVLGKSVRWALELCNVAETFPEDERFPDISWNLYRIAMTYSEDPVTTIREAIEEGMSR